MLAQIIAQLSNLEAFSSVCPSVKEVSTTLQELGFYLTFEMDRKVFPKRGKMTLPDMPAQYHYSDGHSTELIFLAGEDHAEQDMPKLPPHASRWWLYPGTSQCSYNLVTQSLSAKFGLDWK